MYRLGIYYDNMLLNNNISSSCPVGKSDHVVVEADLNVEIPKKQSTFTKYYYEKGITTKWENSQWQNLPRRLTPQQI